MIIVQGLAAVVSQRFHRVRGRPCTVKCFQQAETATPTGLHAIGVRPALVAPAVLPCNVPTCLSAVAGHSNKVKLSFKLPYRCSFGQELCLVGSGEFLGNWSVENGKRMHWTDGDVWTVDFEVWAG